MICRALDVDAVGLTRSAKIATRAFAREILISKTEKHLGQKSEICEQETATCTGSKLKSKLSSNKELTVQLGGVAQRVQPSAALPVS
jgi:hypothetical protein